MKWFFCAFTSQNCNTINSLYLTECFIAHTLTFFKQSKSVFRVDYFYPNINFWSQFFELPLSVLFVIFRFLSELNFFTFREKKKIEINKISRTLLFSVISLCQAVNLCFSLALVALDYGTSSYIFFFYGE